MMSNRRAALEAYRSLSGSRETLSFAVPNSCWEIVIEIAIEELARAEADPAINLRFGHDAPVLAHRVWRRTRGTEYAPGRTVGDSPGVGLNVIEIGDPCSAIERIIRILIGAGSVEKTMITQRDALDQQLRVFRRLRQEAEVEAGDPVKTP